GFSIPYIIDTEILPQYHKAMERLEINKATDVLWSLIGRLDGYITDYEPFKLIKTNKNKTENIIWNLLYGLHNITELLSPILPSTAEIMHKHIKKTVDGEDIKFSISLLDEPLFLRK
ncbi:MAG TPA: hypothetical protein ENI66_01050, partial [Candidatus Yonathbacteria bacterium]|nr:hypothetical protein [Candidatus Yonathbacteria bacterium]